MKEQRFIQTEIRSEAEGVLVGRALTYGSYSTDRNLGFRERIMPGAFSKSLKRCASGKCDHYATFNHNIAQIIARCANGTLQISGDNRGVNFRTKLDMGVSYAQDLWRNVRSGIIRGCSFGMVVNGQDWDDMDDEETGERCVRRSISDADLIECSPVVFPAYDDEGDTDVQARAASLFPEGIPVEIRSRFPNMQEHLLPSAVIDARNRAKAARLNSEMRSKVDADSATERRRQAAIRQRELV
jgi:HK97 family phage prohead protease